MDPRRLWTIIDGMLEWFVIVLSSLCIAIVIRLIFF